MKIYAIIPARYGSTRFPGKPLAPIAGKPMIQHVYEHALACPEVLDVFVATDDDRISECVRDFGGKTVMTKKGHPSGTDRIAEASQKMNLQKDDLIVNIQGDQPLFQPSSISQLIRPLVEDRDIAMSTLKYQITDQQEVQHPNHVKVVTDAPALDFEAFAELARLETFLFQGPDVCRQCCRIGGGRLCRPLSACTH